MTKPFQKTELITAIKIALNKHNELTTLSEKTTLSQENKEQTIFLKNVDKFDNVFINDICFVESQKNYLLIHIHDLVYKHRATIKSFLELLPQDNFVKTHRAFIINLQKIQSVDKVKGIANIIDKNIPISKPFMQEVLNRINRNLN